MANICGCRYSRKVAKVIHCPLHAATPSLVTACRKAMHCLTAEDENEWKRSQSYAESPYYFLWRAISDAGGMQT
jgi:hypothetical protein